MFGKQFVEVFLGVLFGFVITMSLVPTIYYLMTGPLGFPSSYSYYGEGSVSILVSLFGAATVLGIISYVTWERYRAFAIMQFVIALPLFWFFFLLAESGNL